MIEGESGLLTTKNVAQAAQSRYALPLKNEVFQMDSKSVNKEIRKTIRPFLKERGFTRFSPRYCWRHREKAIDVIHFWSPYNWIYAEVKGITTFSFQVELGIYFVDIPSWDPDIREENGRLLPKDYESHFRRTLEKTIEQPECTGKRLWYVEPTGANLGEVVNDVRFVIEIDALPWFDEYTPESFFELIKNFKGGDPRIGMVCGGKYMRGYLCMSLGHYEMAIKTLEAYLRDAKKASKLGLGSYNRIHQTVEADIDYMKVKLTSA